MFPWCGGLNDEHLPYAHASEHLFSSQWDCLERLLGLIGRSMPLEVVSEHLKTLCHICFALSALYLLLIT